MKISMWNLYNRLPCADAVPMIRDGSPTITCARWIVTSQLNPDAVYIGRKRDFFDTIKDDVLIVHRYDMILVKNADPEELFNEICSIIEEFSHWDYQLAQCMRKDDGLQKMLDLSHDILPYPCYIYAPDGSALAISSHYDSTIHWHWKEILENQGLPEERFRYLKDFIQLTYIFRDTFPTLRSAKNDSYQYLHCNLSAHGTIIGHFVLFGFLHPIESGTEYLMNHLVVWMTRYVGRHFEQFSPASRLSQALAPSLTSGHYDQKAVAPLLQELKWNDSDHYQFFLFQENMKGEPVLLTKVYQNLTDQLSGAIIFIAEQQLTVLVNLSRQAASPYDSGWLKPILQDNFLCGISSTFTPLPNCCLYYRPAQEELDRCHREGLLCSNAMTHGFSYYRSLLLKDPLALTYVSHELLYLNHYDTQHGTSYYNTLKIFCLCSFHMSDTARFLSIHRNSLTYRLNKIRELIDFSLFDRMISRPDPETMIYLFFSIFIIDNSTADRQS